MSNQLADEFQKRLYTLENMIFKMVDVIDMAKKFDDRLKYVERRVNLLDDGHDNYNELQTEIEFLNRRISNASLDVEELKERLNEKPTKMDSSSIGHGDCCHLGHP